MIVPGVGLGRRSDRELASLLAMAEAADVTYPHRGSTLAPEPRPEGRLRRVERPLGHGQAAFQAACRGIRSWAPHHALGARVHPPDAPIEPGTTLLVVLPCGPFEVVAPNRIVQVVDDAHLGRFGFAYGTLPGHPECGEESFLVGMSPAGVVTACVTVDAAPATWLTRLGAPTVRAVQDLAVRRYMAGIAAAVEAARA